MQQPTRLTHPSRRSFPLAALLAGVLAAIAVLSSVIEGLLEDHPVRMAALFLVAGAER